MPQSEFYKVNRKGTPGSQLRSLHVGQGLNSEKEQDRKGRLGDEGRGEVRGMKGWVEKEKKGWVEEGAICEEL